MNIEIGISRNTKCAIWNGFPRSSHISICLSNNYLTHSFIDFNQTCTNVSPVYTVQLKQSSELNKYVRTLMYWRETSMQQNKSCHNSVKNQIICTKF